MRGRRLSQWTRVALVMVATSAGLVGASASATSARVVLTQAPPVPSGYHVLHHSSTTTFDIVLKENHASELRAFLTSLTSPASSNYHHYLTPSSFARRFGATSTAVASVESYLRQSGLRVRSLSSNHLIIGVAGTTTSLAHTFDARLVTLLRPNGTTAVQFASTATLPASVARYVGAVYGLTNSLPHVDQQTPLTTSSVSTPSSCSQIPITGTPGNTPVAFTIGHRNYSGYTVQQQAQAYGLSTQWQNGITGVGQTIGLYELETYLPSDVANFESCYGLTNQIIPKYVDGGANGNTGEATLDVEEASALAPGATIEVYQGPNNGSGPLDLYTLMADQDTATVISTSWGSCELDPSDNAQDVAAESVIFQQMAAQGQTVIDAAGDNGSSDCYGDTDVAPQKQDNLVVDDPASQPYVTAVGGLSVYNISNPPSQSVWNSPTFNQPAAGGGGVSLIWPCPSWQQTQCLLRNEDKRMVPDLSVMADPNTGFIMYWQGQWQSTGGTSIGAPLVADLVATAAQYCSVPRLGFINPQLYQMGEEGTGFVDVTSGNNASENSQGIYTASTGYDMASGWGSPSPSTFYSDLCPTSTVNFVNAQTETSNTTTPAPAAAVVAPSTVSVSGNGHALVASFARVVVKLRNTAGTLLKHAVVSVRVSEAKASPSFLPIHVVTNAAGIAVFDVRTALAGKVTLSVAYGSRSIYRGTIIFSRRATAAQRH